MNLCSRNFFPKISGHLGHLRMRRIHAFMHEWVLFCSHKTHPKSIKKSSWIFHKGDNACRRFCFIVQNRERSLLFICLVFSAKAPAQSMRSAQIAVAPITDYTSSETHNTLNALCLSQRFRDKQHSFACRWKPKNYTRMLFWTIWDLSELLLSIHRVSRLWLYKRRSNT